MLEFQPSKLCRFKLGQIVLTPGAPSSIADAGQQPAEFLSRHAKGWGALVAVTWGACGCDVFMGGHTQLIFFQCSQV